MINKVVSTLAEALDGIQDGASILVGGFGSTGIPFQLIDALFEKDVRHLTIIANNAGNKEEGVARLLGGGRVDKIICTYPRSTDCYIMERLYKEGKIELELVPQGTFTERMRAAGAGIGGFYTPTGVGTKIAEGKEIRNFDGMDYVLERPLKADVALLKAQTADRWGNLAYNKTGMNFAPLMATAASLTVVQVSEIVELGGIDPQRVNTPGIFVQRVVQVGDPL